MLLGSPGAGKTYVLTSFSAAAGERLVHACLNDSLAGDVINQRLVIPLLANLALYQGNLAKLIASGLPTGVDLDSVFERFDVSVILDAANEMPETFIEKGIFRDDLLELRNRYPVFRLIIAGRPGGWTEKSICLNT